MRSKPTAKHFRLKLLFALIHTASRCPFTQSSLSYLSVFVLHQACCCCSGRPQPSLPHRTCDHRAVRAGSSRSGWCCRRPCGLQNERGHRNSFFPKSRPSSGRRCRSHRSKCTRRLRGYRALGERRVQSVPEHLILEYFLNIIRAHKVCPKVVPDPEVEELWCVSLNEYLSYHTGLYGILSIIHVTHKYTQN